MENLIQLIQDSEWIKHFSFDKIGSNYLVAFELSIYGSTIAIDFKSDDRDLSWHLFDALETKFVTLNESFHVKK